MGDSQILGTWSTNRPYVSHQLLGAQGSVPGSALLRASATRPPCHYSMDNTTVLVFYINKPGDTFLLPTSSSLWTYSWWLHSQEIILRARHIPGYSNVITYLLSRPNQLMTQQYSLHPEIAALIFELWGLPRVDMFGTVHNMQLPLYMYMFPLFPLLNTVEVILMAPFRLSQLLFPHLIQLCVDQPQFLAYHQDLCV